MQFQAKEIEITQEEKNHQVIGRALLLFNKIYEPFVISVLDHHFSKTSPQPSSTSSKEPLWVTKLEELIKSKGLYTDRGRNNKTFEKDANNQYHMDTAFLLVLITQLWQEISSTYLLALLSKTNIPTTLSASNVKYDTLLMEWKSWIHEIRNIRNKWAHQKTFSLREAYRAIDTIHYAIEHMYMVSNKNNIVFEQSMKEIIQLKEYALYKLANEWKIQHPPISRSSNERDVMDYNMNG